MADKRREAQQAMKDAEKAYVHLAPPCAALRRLAPP
jgi:hypothetical protein